TPLLPRLDTAVVYPRITKPPTYDRDVSVDYILTLDSMNVLNASVGDHAGFSDHHPVTAIIGLDLS
ncbi:hypothetical protein, partial [Rhodococcus marinonascens]|uniref:hypothetical protein n=1 Tax=Rhodococcus marinonascens TaxID=38311 RepID=UPI001C3F4FE0